MVEARHQESIDENDPYYRTPLYTFIEACTHAIENGLPMPDEPPEHQWTEVERQEIDESIVALKQFAALKAPPHDILREEVA